MNQTENGNSLAVAADEEVGPAPAASAWKVLIVGDDETLRGAIVQALAGLPIDGRRLQFSHARSTRRALERLNQDGAFAVLLIDAFGAREDGLQLVRSIRQDPRLRHLRIILRARETDEAADIETIRAYDIDHYASGPALSAGSLYASLSSSIRFHAQRQALKVGRQGLDTIVKASGRMMAHPSLRDVATGIIDEIGGVLGTPVDGLVCVRDSGIAGQMRVIAANGPYARHIDQAIDALGNPSLSATLGKALSKRHSLFFDDASVLFFGGKSADDLLAYIAIGRPLDPIRRLLLDVLCTNIAINLDNVILFDRLRDHAYNDQLLHIPNRLDFMKTVGDALAAQRAQKTIAVVDIDHFSHLNDALGHRYGDTLLKAVAARLIANLPADTVISRLAADTFGVLGANQAITPATLLTLFRTPFIVEGAEQSLSATVGFARLSEVEGNGSEAVKSATIALNLAKNTARGDGVYFTRRMEFETRARLELLRELRAAFDHERLSVVYQPQFCLETRQLVGIEALLRWHTEDGRSIAPDDFIPLAESSGLIVGIGRLVLRTACRDLQRLVAGGFRALRVAVNVSVMQFRHPGFMAVVDEALAESGIDPTRLELEITESVAMLDASFMQATFDQLKARGIAIAIDDFGTGFSSLSYLERLKVDRLKIDQSFVNQMMLADSSLRIVETIVQLGHSLRLQLIAEGVESEDQAESLQLIGCHAGQGYLFARPMEFSALRDFIAAPPAGVPAAAACALPPLSPAARP